MSDVHLHHKTFSEIQKMHELVSQAEFDLVQRASYTPPSPTSGAGHVATMPGRIGNGNGLGTDRPSSTPSRSSTSLASLVPARQRLDAAILSGSEDDTRSAISSLLSEIDTLIASLTGSTGTADAAPAGEIIDTMEKLLLVGRFGAATGVVDLQKANGVEFKPLR